MFKKIIAILVPFLLLWSGTVFADSEYPPDQVRPLTLENYTAYAIILVLIAIFIYVLIKIFKKDK